MFKKIVNNYTNQLQEKKIFEKANTQVENFIKLHFDKGVSYEQFLKYFHSFMEYTLKIYIDILEKIKEIAKDLPANEIFEKSHHQVSQFLNPKDFKEYFKYVERYAVMMAEAIVVFATLLNMIKGN